MFLIVTFPTLIVYFVQEEKTSTEPTGDLKPDVRLVNKGSFLNPFLDSTREFDSYTPFGIGFRATLPKMPSFRVSKGNVGSTIRHNLKICTVANLKNSHFQIL